MRLFPSILRGGIGFAAVSTAAFSVWVFGGGWLHHHGGELVMYAGCCLVFVLLSGLFLHPLLEGAGTLMRFYGIFIPAFLAYAVAWCAGWFWLGAGDGEWMASLIGSLAFTVVMAARLKGWRVLLPSALVMFVTHSAGYFAGERVCYASLHSKPSELIWGALYGLGFGVGIGYTFAMMQRSWKQGNS
jgi:CDP-diglyceride synthetase